MAYDNRLAARVRAALDGQGGMEERRMFGGLAFLVHGHMCCGVLDDMLVLRLGPAGGELGLKRPHTKPMDFTGKPMKGMVYVLAEGLRTGAQLQRWIEEALAFCETLPPKVVRAKTKRAESKSRR